MIGKRPGVQRKMSIFAERVETSRVVSSFRSSSPPRSGQRREPMAKGWAMVTTSTNLKGESCDRMQTTRDLSGGRLKLLRRKMHNWRIES